MVVSRLDAHVSQPVRQATTWSVGFLRALLPLLAQRLKNAVFVAPLLLSCKQMVRTRAELRRSKRREEDGKGPHSAYERGNDETNTEVITTKVFESNAMSTYIVSSCENNCAYYPDDAKDGGYCAKNLCHNARTPFAKLACYSK